MDSKTWLKTLKVGDEVAIERYSLEKYEYSIHKIEKITPTGQIKLEGKEVRFKNGVEMRRTGAWDFPDEIKPVTDEIRMRIEESRLRRKLISALTKINISELPTEKLRKIKEIVDGS